MILNLYFKYLNIKFVTGPARIFAKLPLCPRKTVHSSSPVVVALQQGKQRQREKKPENFRRTGSGVGFQKRDWQWGSQSMIPHKSESKPRRDSHSSSNFGPEKNGKVGRMIIVQSWFLLLFWVGLSSTCRSILIWKCKHTCTCTCTSTCTAVPVRARTVKYYMYIRMLIITGGST